jgi:phytoene dehydrogenase-like protein
MNDSAAELRGIFKGIITPQAAGIESLSASGGLIKQMATQYDAIIIGAGMGGLSCGTLLAKRGLRVLICEQSPRVGGCCINFKRDGFTFSPGVHYFNEFGPNGQMENAFHILGIPKEIEFRPQEPQRHFITPDYQITLSSDIDQFEHDLIHLFPSEERSIRLYLNECAKLAKGLKDFPIKSLDLMSLKERFQVLHHVIFNTPILFRYRCKTTHQVLGSYFKDSHLKRLLAFSSRKDASVFTSIGPIMWAINGNFYYIKGQEQQALPRLFLKTFKSYGGEIVLNTLVEKILIRGGKAEGIRIKGGDTIRTRYVVSNADGFTTFERLIGEHLLPNRFIRGIRMKRLSGPMFTVFLGVDLDLPKMGFDGAQIHYYPHMDGDLWDDSNTINFDIEKEKITMHTDSVQNPILAPSGRHSIVISAFTPYELFKKTKRKGPQYTLLKEEITQKIVRISEKIIPGLTNHIMVKEASTPLTFEKETLNRHGATMGWYLSAKELAKIRSQKTPISNFYLAGHWTYPGGGIPMVIMSGINAAELVLRNP